jgi:hypothetical protein
MNHEIEYCTETKLYDLRIDGLYHSAHFTQVEAEIEAGRVASDRAKRPSVAQRIAMLANEAGQALASGDRATYDALKREAFALKAAELGIEYSVFAAEVAEHAAQKAERKAA